MEKFHANGKLLLSCEYLILDHANGLSLPTKKGQSLCISYNSKNTIHWKSLDYKGNCWFETTLNLNTPPLLSTSFDKSVKENLYQIFRAIERLNPSFIKKIKKGCNVTTQLEFPQNWGLGSSSTLISNISKWASVNPYQLLELTFKGSGYDIATARSNKPILYQRTETPYEPNIKTVDFQPVFKNKIYFIHLNQKKNSREAIKHYKQLNKEEKVETSHITNQITQEILKCNTLENFEILLTKHEHELSKLLKTTRIQQQEFKDYQKGVIKSLGAWGGDFVLVTIKEENDLNYFKEKGFNTILSYEQMIL